MHLVVGLVLFVGAIVPGKLWYTAQQPWLVKVDAQQEVSLLLTDFAGSVLEPKGSPDINESKSVDLKELFPALNTPGTYLLYAQPKGGQRGDFVGSPLVITVRPNARRLGTITPMVARFEPLRFAEIETDAGSMTVAFYYDAAPNTVSNFIRLADEGFYDGLMFHRVVPRFVIQAGDPAGDGTGGPGYRIDAEFSDKKHEPGVVSMARTGDPNEAAGVAPRAEFANSAGSQFFICLNYENTQQLDGRYTAFGKVVAGMSAVDAIAATPLTSEGRPQTPPVIRSIKIKLVTADQNPYPLLNQVSATPATAPATQPASTSPVAQ